MEAWWPGGRATVDQPAREEKRKAKSEKRKETKLAGESRLSYPSSGQSEGRYRQEACDWSLLPCPPLSGPGSDPAFLAPRLRLTVLEISHLEIEFRAIAAPFRP